MVEVKSHSSVLSLPVVTKLRFTVYWSKSFCKSFFTWII